MFGTKEFRFVTVKIQSAELEFDNFIKYGPCSKKNHLYSLSWQQKKS